MKNGLVYFSIVVYKRLFYCVHQDEALINNTSSIYYTQMHLRNHNQSQCYFLAIMFANATDWTKVCALLFTNSILIVVLLVLVRLFIGTRQNL